ncbi:hypothetical protein CDL15_Pgr004420 [Punica granatum]|uniref:Uncharacterized protein n=1 Tax=Punica granatum TaxID=22663 RepID=A0A218XH28_PUNGR|nr:hypothetical protein CDL15_Pgr004420 [Punica granatum]
MENSSSAANSGSSYSRDCAAADPPVLGSVRLSGKTMENSSSAAASGSSSSRDRTAPPPVLSLLRLCCWEALHTLKDKRSEMSRILNAGESPEQDPPALDSEEEDLTALLLKAEKLLEEAMESSWKVKAEEMTEERAKEIMAELRVIHERAAEVGREMDALLNLIKDICPGVAKAYVEFLMKKHK